MPAITPPIPARLRPHVRSWNGYDFRLPPDAVHHGVPSTGMTVILSFDQPLDCGWLGETDRGRFDVLVAGLHTRPALIHTHGAQHGIQLSLTPIGARTILGMPAGELANSIAHGGDVGIPPLLHDRLQVASWPQRFAILERHLTHRIHDRDRRRRSSPRPEVIHALRRIVQSHGQIHIEQVSAEVGLSRRHLLTVIRQEIGITPKQAARLARFEYAKRLLDDGAGLSQTAVAAGYADQPHLNREWRALAGMTPLESLDDFPIIQDQEERATADSSS